jgi:hypothetical protein
MNLSSGKSGTIRLSFIEDPLSLMEDPLSLIDYPLSFMDEPLESMLDSIVFAWISNSRRQSSFIIYGLCFDFFSFAEELSNDLMDIPFRKSMFSLLLKESMKDCPFLVEV